MIKPLMGVRRRHKGIVLLAVLWVTMALAAIAISVSQLTRLQVKSNIQQYSLSDRMSLAASAMRLTLDWLTQHKIMPDRRLFFVTTFNNQPITVSVTPANGLIDLNNAPVTLIAALIETSLGLHSSEAMALAINIDVYRKHLDIDKKYRGITSLEQLAEIPGLDFLKIEQIRHSVTCHYQGSGRVNPLAANKDVLMAITRGNGTMTQNIINRQNSALGVETMSIEPTWIESNSASVIYISAYRESDFNKKNLHWIVGLWPNAIDGTPWTILSAYTY